ncbi:MAG TPA: YdcF family protein [Propionibacteriaceae bacterium]|nr:YdcF family protein [Propionibacteriaceae bacterium]
MIAVCLCLMIAGAGVMLTVYGSHDTVRFDEDAVIVLGAALHGNELSRTLTSRLETALDYHERHPDALIVVSGGRSPGEAVAEADAMRGFLVARGVPAAGILVEDRSTSTVENMAFSRELLDQHLAPGYTVAFVTDAFHVYRAGRLADDSGLTARHLHSATPWRAWTANTLRELMGIFLMWISSRR